MSAATAILIPAPRQELAFRSSGGLEITLYWDADEQTTSVEIHQPATQETIALTVPQEDALDAFYHPFAHLGRTSDQPPTTSIPVHARHRQAPGRETSRNLTHERRSL